tara:strand:- start:322 stop:1482 length:1161 start_codon:yes stop_codon:yes gene_type:complete
MINKNDIKILFVRPDLHSTYSIRNSLAKDGIKSSIFVEWSYPDKLLFSKNGIVGYRILENTNGLFKRINYCYSLFVFLLNIPRFNYFVYYGQLSLFPHLDLFFKKSFSLEMWLIKKVFKKKVVYYPPGCRFENLKSFFLKKDQGNVCGNCGYFDHCNDKENQRNFNLIKKYADLNIGFGFVKTESYKQTIFKYKSIDLDLWNPYLSSSESKLIRPKNKKIKILHSNFLKNSGRASLVKNIKGTQSIIKAIDQLIAEGYAIEKVIIEDLHINQMRFQQIKADIVIDQLIYGHWGSTAIESMALGKPVICYINLDYKKTFLNAYPEYNGLPVIESNTKDIYKTLKDLLDNPHKLNHYGTMGREFVEKHYNPDINSKILVNQLLNLNKK